MASNEGNENKATPAKTESKDEQNAAPQARQPIGRTFVRELATESILGLIFWCVFQQLLPSFSLKVIREHDPNYFIICTAWLSPILLAMPVLATSLRSSAGILILRLIMIGSLAAIQVPSFVSRVGVIALGNAASILLMCVTWWHKSAHQRSTSFWGFTLGYFILLCIKLWWSSVNPIWVYSTSNSILIALGVLAAFDRFSAVQYPYPEAKPNPIIGSHWVIMGAGFGSLLFYVHLLFGDSGLVSRWNVQGLPYSGPHPFPASAAMFVELVSGILISTKQDLVTNFLWIWFIGGHLTVGIYFLSGFFGFTCGLFLAPFITAGWPEIIDRVTSCDPIRTLTWAMMVFTAENYFYMASVVPGLPCGWLFQGFSIVVLALSMVLIGRALLKEEKRDPQVAGDTHIAFSDLDRTGKYQMFADVKLFLILILFIGIASCGKKVFDRKIPLPVTQSDPVTFTSLIWTAQYMQDNDGLPSFERTASFLKKSGADVIVLVESDAARLYTNNYDIPMWLGETLYMYEDYGPSPTEHSPGVSLLSKYPILKSEHHRLPCEEGEITPALIATLNISGHQVNVVAAIFPKTRYDQDRRNQTEYISNYTRRSENPVLFLSSLSSHPGNRDYRRLETLGRLKDIDPSDEKRFTYSIMYKNLIKLGFARVSSSDLSPEEIEMAKFQFISVKGYEDNTASTIDKDLVDQSVWFTESFGEYREGAYVGSYHRYQHGTPRYFIKMEEGVQ